MNNPFEEISTRLANIETLLLEIKYEPIKHAESQEPQYLHSLKELAEFLGCSTVTAYKLKSSGRIPFKQFGRKLIFNSDEVLKAL